MAAGRAFTELPACPHSPSASPRKCQQGRGAPLGPPGFAVTAAAHSLGTSIYEPRLYLFLCFKSMFRTKFNYARLPEELWG